MGLCSGCGRELAGEFAFCPFCGVTLGPTTTLSQERRKVVTVVFCDVTGSTALGERLDPESLRAVMARYFDAMSVVIVRHGGTVEKFIGDAVMAVFGVPVLHEDDAVRALRAVMEMRAALIDLNVDLVREYGTTLELRTGVNSGVIVTGTDERLVTGDAVNVAARLEQAAEPGEVLIGEATLKLARGSVVVAAVDALTLKGKSGRVPAWRLVSVAAHTADHRSDSPLVGRKPELATLMAAWDQVRTERRCVSVTVTGDAGVGKSRLVSEFLASVGAADVVRGRCPSYGEGVTYSPVVEVIKELEERRPGLGLDPVASDALTGLLANADVASTDQIAWAFRKLLEAAAAVRPLIAVFDNIQWGGEAFLELLEHIVYVSANAPVLVCCMARPDLLDRRAGWAGVLRIEPLNSDQAGELIDAQLVTGPLETGVRDRILAAAGGNPLFVEELTTMLATSDVREPVAIPPTIQALLSTRLDQLDPAELKVLERASIEGEVFHRGSVRSLMPDESHLTTRLAALVRKELIRPERAMLAGEDAFRFRHLLIRDAAYDALAKATRAELHEHFTAWIESHAEGLIEVDEIVGYHLEQAYMYRCQLGPADERVRLLATRAAARLASAGRRADARGDVRAAIALLGRAVSLLPSDDASRPLLLVDFALVLAYAQELDRAEAAVAEAVVAAARAGDPKTRAHVTLAAIDLRLQRGGSTAKDGADILHALEIFEQHADERGLARGWDLMIGVHEDRFEMVAAQAARAAALTHARNAGDTERETLLRIGVANALLDGPSPFGEVSRYQREILDLGRASHTPHLEASALVVGGRLRAMDGDFVEARALIARAREMFEQLGVTVVLPWVSASASEVEDLAGDLAAAEAHCRAGLRQTKKAGHRERAAAFAFEIARFEDLQGRYAEAANLLPTFLETQASEDRWLQLHRRCWCARVLVRQGEVEEAVRLALEVVELAPPPELPLLRAGWLNQAATTLSLAGCHDEAISIAESAFSLYEAKGNVVMTNRLQDQLSELRRQPQT